MRNLSQRTCGELAAMRDTLVVAERETHDPALKKVISVLYSIVADAPFYHSPAVREAVAYKPRKR